MENNEEDFLIPIDDAITTFMHHLDAHDRTILSAKFGDGKSFFLSQFMSDKDVAEKYTFLTIFPVNYQVVENRDVFDLIKRDILLQMIFKGIIEPDIAITKEQALALFIQCQPFSILESFIPLLSSFVTESADAKTLAKINTAYQIIKSICQKINKGRKRTKDAEIESFFKAVEKNPTVGQDVISCIIHQSLDKYREQNPDKQVVLVIEDMDRIDPGHLFRILNVFSAHIDYCYRLGIQPDSSLIGNKFGLDKVIFVLDYDNLKRIYAYLYGAETSYEGYIEKFCSSNYFSYSLREQRDLYFRAWIIKETGLPDKLVSICLNSDDLDNLSLRKVANAIRNTENFVIESHKGKTRQGKNVKLHPGILKLIAILRKCGFSDSEIIRRILNAIKSKDVTTNCIFKYIGPYLCIARYKNSIGYIRFAKSIQICNSVNIDSIDNEGCATCSFFKQINEVGEEFESQGIHKLLDKILEMVSK